MFSLICSQRKEKSIAPNSSRSLSDIVLGCKIDRPCPHRMAVYSIEHCQSELKRSERSVIKLRLWKANTTLWLSHFHTIASLGGQYHSTMTITLSNDCIYSTTAMAASFCGTWNSSCPAHRVLSPITGNHNFLLRLSLRVLYQFVQLNHNVSIEGLFIQ